MRRTGWFLLALVIVLWGAGPMSIGVAVGPDGGFGPLWLNASRLTVGGLTVLGLAALRGRPLVPQRGLVRLVVIGLIAWTLGSGVQVIAQTEVPSGLAALVLGLGPGLTMLLEAGIDRRLPGIQQILGILAGVVGLALLVGGGAADGAGVVPILLLLLAAVAWGGAAVAQARFPTDASPLVAAGWQMIAGGVGLVLLAVGTSEPLPSPTPAGWAAWAFLAFGAAAVGFLAWIEVLRRLPVMVAMTQPTLSTVVAVALGVVVLGEPIGAVALLGVVLSIAGAAGAATPRGVLGARGLLGTRGLPGVLGMLGGRGLFPRAPGRSVPSRSADATPDTIETLSAK
jgi:drug/metabolite transporter (DMT)-like permease